MEIAESSLPLEVLNAIIHSIQSFQVASPYIIMRSSDVEQFVIF